MAESIDWSIRLTNPGGIPAAAVLTVLVIGVVAAGVWELRKVGSPRRRWALRALRLTSGVLVLLAGLQPVWAGQRSVQSRGALAVLADVSRSMAVRDREGRSRAGEARRLLDGWRHGAPEAIEVHRFAAEPEAADLATLAKDYAAHGDDTRIAQALGAVAGMERSLDLGAIVLVSDGADLASGWEPSDLKRLGVRVHTVAVGEPRPPRDQAIASVQADARGFLREPAQVQVVVRASGGLSGRVPVTLRRGDQVVREVMVDVPDSGEAKADIGFMPDALGRDAYSVSIPVDARDTVPENNERAFLMTVVRDRLRVLLVCGHPSWDARFLRGFLKADPSVDLISFFILRTVHDMIQASPDELSLIPFPTEELFDQHLDSFDVVIFQNFEYGPYRMARHLPRIRDYVRNGGAFAMVGGSRSLASGGYAGTPIAEILPVELTDERAAEVSEAPFRPEIAEAYESHPLIAWRPEDAASRAVWKRLAPLVGMNLVEGAVPDAQVLLTHPELRTPRGEPMPLLTLGSFGRGRSMVLATDASWRWGITTAGSEGDASAYHQLWDRALRWLSRDPALEPSRVELERAQVGAGAALSARVLARDARYAPLSVSEVELAVESTRGERVDAIRVVTDGDGRARARLSAPSRPGAYRLRLRGPADESVLAEAGFVVESGGQELARPAARHELLRDIARHTGGSFYASADEAPRLGDMEASRARILGSVERAPFSETWFVLLAMAALVAEWAARRAWGRA